MEEGKLLYAIILSGGAGERRSRGAEEQRGRVSSAPQHLSTSAQEAPPQQCTGIDDAPLETVPYRDLAAVVSSIDLERFGQACPGRGDRPVAPTEEEERLREDLVRYQQVNLALLQHYTVVPMRFGFTARDREHVEEVLEKTYLQMRILLNRLTGKVELIVQAFWDLPKVLQEIAAQDESILRAKLALSQVEGREASCNPQSAIRNPQSIEVGRRLFTAAEARKKGLAAVIHASLSLWAIDSSEGPLKTLNHSLPLEGGGRGRGCVEHIFNRSYLVEKEYEPLFDAAIDQLGTRYQSDITFNYIGPLPAYSFTNLEFNQGNFEVIDRARQTLALPEYASLEDIKGAYRRLALTSHPDRHPEDPQAEARFRIVTHAYEVLETYCRSLQNFPGEIPLCSFAREQVERTFVVKEKR